MIELVRNNSVSPTKIKVIGVGGAGGNAVRRMVSYGIQGVEFWAMNTDIQVIEDLPVPNKIVLGHETTKGLGAGAKPEVGEKAALEAREQIEGVLKGSDMIFVTAGMGGGTGTGASPVIAEIAKKMNILVVGVVTTPFAFEGAPKMNVANGGIQKLIPHVDTLISIPNQNLVKMNKERKTLVSEAFSQSDDVLRQAVQGISDIITIRGEVNVDFADVRTIMENRGGALMGLGVGHGENRGIEAVEKAINSPLLDSVSIRGAKGIIVNVTGGNDLTLYEVDEIISLIRREADEQAQIIFGTVLDDKLQDQVRVTVLATGFPQEQTKMEEVKRKEEKKMVFTLYAGNDLDIPTFQRRRLAENRRFNYQPSERVKEEDLDIPTFLRRDSRAN